MGDDSSSGTAAGSRGTETGGTVGAPIDITIDTDRCMGSGNCMFWATETFALWDGRARKLVLVRDHMGMRVLHYHLGKDFIAFATEIKALWAVEGVPREIAQMQLDIEQTRELTSM